MTASIPAGSYHIVAGGYQPGGDAQLHADVLFRPRSGSDQIIASADSTPIGSDAGYPGSIDANVAGGAAPGGAGDLLVMRVHMVSGTSGYIELNTSLTIP